MFNLSPTQQFLIQKGIQSLQQQQGQPGQQGMMPQAQPGQMMRRPMGGGVSPQSNSGMMAPPAQPGAGNVNPAIMNRFRQMLAARMPPQMQSPAANQMMPPTQ